MKRGQNPDPYLRTEWRVVEANGKPYPPGASPFDSRDAAVRRAEHYDSITQATGEARLPLRPLRIEWRSVKVGPWNRRGSGLDLVEPKG